jgi:excisionase family DNA binding protein
MSRNDRKRGSVEEHLSLAEAAERMGISERTARRWIKSGKLRAYKPGRDYWIPAGALTELVEESEVHPKAPASSQPSFNGLLEEERHLSRFSEAIIAAAASWGEAMANPDMENTKRFGLIEAALELSRVIEESAEEEDWDAIPNQERLAIVTTMEKLVDAANLGLRHAGESKEARDQEEEVKQRRDQVRELTRQISA